jgi:pyruvate dehydrogenase kinase 2/3/4
MEKLSDADLTNSPGVSLRQMVQFGEKPSTGTLFRASQFLSEELPIRLAQRVQELSDLPDGLNEMPSIQRVRDWYAQSFEVRRYPDIRRFTCDSSICAGIDGFTTTHVIV